MYMSSKLPLCGCERVGDMYFERKENETVVDTKISALVIEKQKAFFSLALGSSIHLVYNEQGYMECLQVFLENSRSSGKTYLSFSNVTGWQWCLMISALSPDILWISVSNHSPNTDISSHNSLEQGYCDLAFVHILKERICVGCVCPVVVIVRR